MAGGDDVTNQPAALAARFRARGLAYACRAMPTARRGLWLIAAAAILSQFGCLRAGFVWLDHAHIEDGLALAKWNELHRLFTQGFAGTGYYRPLMSVSLSLDAALGGGPLLYHSVTLLWHVAAALLLADASERL